MQQVEILKLLYRDCGIVILDEPTAVLTDREINSLFGTFKKLARAGKSLILITHKLGEIKQISDRVAVMRRGRLLGVWNTETVDEYDVSRIMIGGESVTSTDGNYANSDSTGNNFIGSNFIGGNYANSDSTGSNFIGSNYVDDNPAPSAKSFDETGRAAPVLAFENVTVLRRGQSRPVLDRINFKVRAGEILGFAGVGGNGLGTLEAVLGGFLPVTEGRILHHGEDISRSTIRARRRRGLAYVPGDRLSVGSAPDADLSENLIINRRQRLSPGGVFRRGEVKAFTRNLIEKYRIAGKPEMPLRSLSGGNIQKLILAREIEQYKDYIIFSEPTWGLDISSSAYVYEQIDLLRERGAAIIIISSNLDELLMCADSIIVFYRGSAAARLPNAKEGREDRSRRAAMKEEIGMYMLGLGPASTGSSAIAGSPAIAGAEQHEGNHLG
jgi:simple sugar transport system ATP-binding protein